MKLGAVVQWCDGRPRLNHLSRNDVEEWLSCAAQEVIAWIAAKSWNDFLSRNHVMNGIHVIASTVHFILTEGNNDYGWAMCSSRKTLEKKPTFQRSSVASNSSFTLFWLYLVFFLLYPVSVPYLWCHCIHKYNRWLKMYSVFNLILTALCKRILKSIDEMNLVGITALCDITMACMHTFFE